MSPGRWRLLRLLGGVALLSAALAATGPGAVVAGVRSLDAGTLLLGTLLGVPATVACAWRWRLVATRLGAHLELGPAVAACYRAQLLNTTLPGGVVGDVHRGVVHGHAAGHTGRGLRAVAWERVTGQVVLLTVAAAVLLLAPSPVRPAMPAVLLTVAAGCVAAWALLRRLPLAEASWAGRLLLAVRSDVRVGLLVRGGWPGVVLASLVALGCYLATYLLAARAVGVTAPAVTVLPLAVLVLVAAGLPTNVAGWGPREGVAAWAFAAAGLGAGQGLATAVAYAVLVLVANLPGAVVLVLAGTGATGRRADDPPAGREPVAGRSGSHA